MWLTDLLPDTSKVCPTCPTCKNEVGQHEIHVAVSLSDLSDLSDQKKDMGSPPVGKWAEQTIFTQISSEDPLSVRLDGKSLCQKLNEEKPVGQPYGDNTFPVDGASSAYEPTPAQLDHARRMLVDCPSTGGKLHCWYCSRCNGARVCLAWRVRRYDVELYRRSGKPDSLYLAEAESVEAVQ